MVKFIGGPATGVTLELGRTPIMLRVVCNAAGEWDGLDQLADVAEPSEKIYLYWLHGEIARGFVDGRDRDGRRFRRQYVRADYVPFPDPPPEEILRDNAAWSAWCTENRERILAERPKGDA